MNPRAKTLLSHASVHTVLLIYTFIALFPTLLIVMNSTKARLAVPGAPLEPPTPSTFDLVGYQTVFSNAHFEQYLPQFLNRNNRFSGFDFKLERNGFVCPCRVRVSRQSTAGNLPGNRHHGSDSAWHG